MSNDMLWNSDENRQKIKNMKFIMIETAGHVDHGKTSLVQAVSGKNTDTLIEEKKRGITIETGFTSFKLNKEITAIIADVPGHEHFITNMLMGSCHADIVYLLIDSKEGIMPQTVEHLKLISHLSPSATIIAIISKIDLVNDERLEELKNKVHDFLIKENIKNFYIQYFSAISNKGLKEILDLTEKISISIERKKDIKPFRMSIARVFSLKGIGTVVTGYPLSGEVNINSKLEILPSKKSCSIKNIQIAENNVKNASVGSTIALNLRNISKEDIIVGNTIADINSFELKTKAIAKIKIDYSINKFKSGQYIFFSGTFKDIVKIKILDSKQEIIVFFKDKTVCEEGDKFILRTINPQKTIGFGIITKTFEFIPKENNKINFEKDKFKLEEPIKNKFIKVLKKYSTCGISLGNLEKELFMIKNKFLTSIKLLEEAKILKIFNNFVLLRDDYEDIKNKFISMLKKNKICGLSDIRKLSKGGRHFLISLLEEFDREGITIRKENGRILKQI